MRTVLESASARVTLGAGHPFRVIGRCAGDRDHLAAEVRAQLAGGADMLCVPPGAVRAAQRLTGRPLCLDGTAPVPLAAALAAYPGKALVSGVDAATLDAVLPLVARYGAALVVVPGAGADPPKERLERTHRIVDAAAGAYGLPIEDILIDPIGTRAEATLETIALIGAEYGVNMVFGAGGPPVQRTALVEAVRCGLTGAVLDARAADLTRCCRTA